MNMPPIVSPQEWEAAREELLVKEKELTRARDALAAERRRMPRMAVEKEYRFEGPDGPASLLDLFEGRRQLIVYRFFFEPGVAGWPESGCRGCSFMADQVAHLAHLNARDTTLAYVSRAPQADIERWKARMGWEIPWYTITDDFDADFGVDEWHGTNAFFRDGDRIFRTYFVNNRGDEALGSTWSLPRHHRARPPGEVGGLARGLPADAALRVVEPPRRVRRGDRLRGGAVGARPPRSAARGARGRDRRRQDAAHRAHLPGARRGRLRRLDQRGGAAPLVPRPSPTGRRPRPRSTCASAAPCASSCATPTRTSTTAAAVTTPRSTRRPASRSPGPGTATTTRQTLIEIDFEEADGITTVRFTHSGLRDEEAVRTHEDGWTSCFDNLERTLEAVPPGR